MHSSEAFSTVAHLYGDPRSAWASWEAALARLDEQPAFDLSLVEGPHRDLQLRLFRVPTGPLAESGVGMLVHDVTDDRDLTRAKDELLAMVSHDLASPATNLVSCAELLAVEAMVDPEHGQMLATMVLEGRRLNVLIHDFMDV
ncbi:MAG: histidine kinase dimerization/phospho-acceptor domain-containing protein [Chloroflexota bacterium]